MQYEGQWSLSDNDVPRVYVSHMLGIEVRSLNLYRFNKLVQEYFKKHI